MITNDAMMDMTLNQWCSECESLRESLSELKSAYAHQMNIICGLKEKIIPTDQLIIDVYTKQEENQVLAKSLEISKRLNEDLSKQLRSTLAQLEPLREAKDKSDRHVQHYEKDIERLRADVDAYKNSQQQLKAAHDSLHEKLRKSEEEKKEALNNFRKIESRLKRCQDELAVRKDDVSKLKIENATLHNEIKELKLEVQLANYNENKVSYASSMDGLTDFDVAQLFESDLMKPLPPMISPLASPVSVDLKLSDEGSCSSDDDSVSIDHYASLLESELHLSKDIGNIQSSTLNDEILSGCNYEYNEGVCEDIISKVLLNEDDEMLDSSQLKSQLSRGFSVSCDIDLLSAPGSVGVSVASLASSFISSQQLNTLETLSLTSFPQHSPSTGAIFNSEHLDCSKKYTEIKPVETQKISVALTCIQPFVSTDSGSIMSSSSSKEDRFSSLGSPSKITFPSLEFECQNQNAQSSGLGRAPLVMHQSGSVKGVTEAVDVPFSDSCDSFDSKKSVYSCCVSSCSASCPTYVSCNNVSSPMHEENLSYNASNIVLSSAVNVVSAIIEPICSPCVTVDTSSNSSPTLGPSFLLHTTVAASSSCVTCPASNLSSNYCISSPAVEIALHSSVVSSGNLLSLNDEVLSYNSNLNESPFSSGSKSGIIDNVSPDAKFNPLSISSCIESQLSTASSLCDGIATSVIDLLPHNVDTVLSNDAPLSSSSIAAALDDISAVHSTEQFNRVSPSLCINIETPYIMLTSPSTMSAATVISLPASLVGTTAFSSLQSTVSLPSTSSTSLVTALPSSSSQISNFKSHGDGDLGSLDVTKSHVDLDSSLISVSKAKSVAVDHDSAQKLLISLEEIFEELKIPSPLPPLSPVSSIFDAVQTRSAKSSSSNHFAPNVSVIQTDSPDFKLVSEGRRTRRKSYPPESVYIAANKNACGDYGSVSKPCSDSNYDKNCLSNPSAVQMRSKSTKCTKGGKRNPSMLTDLKTDASCVSSALSNSSNLTKIRGEKRKTSESDTCSTETKVCRSLRSNTIIESPCLNDIPSKTKVKCQNISQTGASVIQKSMGKRTQKGIPTEATTAISVTDDSLSLSLKTSSDVVAFLIKKTLLLSEDLVSMWYNRCRSGFTSETKPLTTSSQEKVVAECQKLCDSQIKEFCDQAVQILGRKNEDTVMNGNMALCCVLVSLCRLMGDSERVRMFVYEAIRQQYCGYCSLILCVAAVWPMPLRQANSSDVAFPLLDVLQYIVCAKALSASTLKKQKILFCLEEFCGWKLVTETASELSQRILNQLEEHLQQTSASSEAFTLSVKMSFSLLSVVEGWQWSNNFVVIQLLWPILSSWAADSEAKNQAFVEAVIAILGSVMCNCPATCKNNTDQVIDVLLALLQEPSVAISIQLAVLQSLLMLTKFQPDRCATMCIQWVESHRKHLDHRTKQMLRDYHKSFSPELKYLSQLSID